jgi:hypothetical protein
MVPRRGVVWVCLGFLTCLFGFSTWAAESETVGILDNLFLEAGGGIKKPIGEDSTWFGTGGFNWGIPLTPNSDGLGLGFQAGADVSPREDDTEWDATMGFFGRNFRLGDEQLAGAALVDYHRTAIHNNLWAVRPIIGTTVGARNEVGVVGVIGVNRESSTSSDGITVTTIRQETLDSAEMFFNHYWSETLATELALGYQFSHIDEVLFRGQIVYGITQYVDMSVGGEVNGNGNYACGAKVSFHFGGIGRHDSLNNIYAWRKQDFYTPFPKRGAESLSSRPVFKSVAPAGGGGGGGI